ncbi:MAG: hypothetical protein EXS69_02505 [Candidatus Zambryskibacteria bacterium]|nr:hypothetical protein [Candidatus Zambryskibacteria bacterium]
MRKMAMFSLLVALVLSSACAARQGITPISSNLQGAYEAVGVADYRTTPFETAMLSATNQARESLARQICGNGVNAGEVMFFGVTLASETETLEAEKSLRVRLYLNKTEVDENVKSICRS